MTLRLPTLALLHLIIPAVHPHRTVLTSTALHIRLLIPLIYHAMAIEW